MNRPYDKAKIAKILAAAYTACSLAYLLLLFWTNQRVFLADVSGCEVVSGEGIEYGFDTMYCEYGYAYITGHAYEKGEPVKAADTAVLAYDPGTGLYYELPTRVVKNTKLTQKEDDGCNYDYAQFKSVVFLDKIPDGSKACIWYRVNGKSKLILTENEIYRLEAESGNGSASQ